MLPLPPVALVMAGSQQYDHDKMVPMYGFGARVGGAVKHAFALNFNEEDPEVQGVNGMLAAYRCVLPTWVAVLHQPCISPHGLCKSTGVAFCCKW